MIFKCLKLSFHIETDIDISKLKNQVIDDNIKFTNYHIISLMIFSQTELSYCIVNDICLTKIIISYPLTKSVIG